ncbi:unnamed protein product [Chironomus riparius]|uniref:Uncharacterized protein n=1 Tax=Chironomus riparius TaxID=315576 RepID=A0A9N9WTN8_9DIPT|nr:unnamed protein product [Chironomus riparius]
MGTKKRKKSISPIPSKSVEKNKVKTDAEIISDGLQATKTNQPDATQDKDKPAKPIYVKANIQDTKKVISSLKMTTRVLCKIRETNCTQISCFNIKDKKILIEKLTSEQIEYHTFTEKCEKSNKFILKDFYLCIDTYSLRKFNQFKFGASHVGMVLFENDEHFCKSHYNERMNSHVLNLGYDGSKPAVIHLCGVEM